MTNVLVTGATTPIGCALVQRLAEHASIGRVLATMAKGEAMPAFRSANVDWIVCDLTRERDVRNLTFGLARDAGVEIVVHAAQRRAARDSGRRVRAQNVDSTRELLDFSERLPSVRRFVYRSYADVYRVRPDYPTIISEDHPLEMSRNAPQWVRDRVEADLTVGLRMGMSKLSIAVLRAAECLAPNCGSQLYDYLTSRVCYTPLGFDPMLNILSVDDLARALELATFANAQGVFNIAGADTLPLSAVIRAAKRIHIPVPSPLLAPLYGMRSIARGTDFRYDQNYWRFHFGGVLDFERSRRELGYEPRERIDWRRLEGERPPPLRFFGSATP